MRPSTVTRLVGAALTAAASAAAVTIAEINGNKFVSPLDGQTVTNVTGLVTATNDNGLFLRSLEPDNDPATSEGIYVFGKSIVGLAEVGDIISLNGQVEMYR